MGHLKAVFKYCLQQSKSLGETRKLKVVEFFYELGRNENWFECSKLWSLKGKRMIEKTLSTSN